MDSDSFQLSPADVEARFAAAFAAGTDDPLFRPIDADDFDVNGANASDYSNLRQNGLIRVRLPLPANMKLVDPASCLTDGLPAPCDSATDYTVSATTFTDVWRAVPSVLDVQLTGPDADTAAWARGPNPQGGYQVDGREGTLADQALGALRNHAQVATDPDQGTLDDLTAYETTLLADPEPPLDDLETMGKTVFDRACGLCHNGPGMARPLPRAADPLFALHDVQSACPRPVDTAVPPRWNFPPCAPGLARNERTYEISFADGYRIRRTTSDPGRALLSGFVASAGPPPYGSSCLHPPCTLPFLDDWQKLEISPLHGISRTAPYFHNNSAATLEDVVINYEEHYKFISTASTGPPLPLVLSTDGIHVDRPNVPSERAALVAYLKRL